MSFAKVFFGSRHEDRIAAERKTVSDRPCQAVEDALPQPIEDSFIKSEMYTILEYIEEHVRQFYFPEIVFGTVRISKPDSRRDLYSESLKLTDGIQHEPAEPQVHPLAQQFPDEIALRLWMMNRVTRLLITAISPFENDNDAGSLLPEEIVFFLEAVEEPERQAVDAGYQSIFGQWKALSSYLLNHSSVKDDNRKEFERRFQTSQRRIIDEINHEFESLYNPHDEVRIKHLKQILRRTAEFGRLMWSQVAQFQFDWGVDVNYDKVPGASVITTSSGRRRVRTRTRDTDGKKRRSGRRHSPDERPSTLYMPGLIKLTDHRGRVLNPVKCILEPRKEIMRTPQRWATGDARITQPTADVLVEAVTEAKNASNRS